MSPAATWGTAASVGTTGKGVRVGDPTPGERVAVTGPDGGSCHDDAVFRPAESSRRTWWSLFASLLIGCLAWSVATPLMASADEAAHAVRAAGVARGQLRPERT